MAETLGSLIDKLSIKNLRLWHIDEAREEASLPDADLDKKRATVVEQQQDLIDEINGFVALALAGKIELRNDEKVKLYNDPAIVGKTGHLKGIGEATDALAMKNIKLWHLEDMARDKEASDRVIADVKRKIDVTNQQRNDMIDRIDVLFAQQVAEQNRK